MKQDRIIKAIKNQIAKNLEDEELKEKVLEVEASEKDNLGFLFLHKLLTCEHLQKIYEKQDDECQEVISNCINAVRNASKGVMDREFAFTAIVTAEVMNFDASNAAIYAITHAAIHAVYAVYAIHVTYDPLTVGDAIEAFTVNAFDAITHAIEAFTAFDEICDFIAKLLLEVTSQKAAEKQLSGRN